MNASRHALPPRAWVLLRSGKRLDLLHPHPMAWDDDDLATGLAHLPLGRPLAMKLEFAFRLFSKKILERPNTRKRDSKKTSEQECLPRSVAAPQGFGLRPAARPCPAATAAPAE